MKLGLLNLEKALIAILATAMAWTSLISSPPTAAETAEKLVANAAALACETNVTTGEDLSSVRIGDVFTYYHHIKTSKERLLTKDVFGSEDDLLLGFNAAGHVYVQNTGVRVDGNTPLRRSAVQPTDYVPQGIVIRVAKREAERAVMMSYQRSRWNISCANTACGVMKKAAGIVIGQRGGRESRPDKLLLKILKEGLYATDGSKVPFEVYVIGKDTFLTRYRRYYRNSEYMNTTYKIALPAVGLGVSGFVLMTIASLLHFVEP